MDLQQLTAFDRIVRQGSFSRAARELHIAQPTISARIQALEQEVGGPLLARSNQGVKLTALGVSFLPYARRALAIKETLDLSAQPWATYGILAEIATAQGDSAAAARWRRQAQESYAAYAGAAHQLPSWAPDFIRAVVAAAQGNQEAQAAVAQILPQLEERGWTDMTASIKQILAGVLDENALYANLDHQDAYIIRAILQQLAGV